MQRSAEQLSVKGTVLPAGVYTLSLRGVGNTPGYGLIYLSATQSDFRKDVYSTPQMGGGTTFTYTLMLHEETAVRVASIWGTTQEENPLKDEAVVYYGRPPNIIKPTEEESQTGDGTAAESGTAVDDSAGSTASTPGGESAGGSTASAPSGEPASGSTASAPGGETAASSTAGAPAAGSSDTTAGESTSSVSVPAASGGSEAAAAEGTDGG